MTAAEMLTKPLAHHGEGPVWVARDTSLYWVDMLAGDVLQLDGEGQVSRHHVGSVAAALRPRADGGLVVAVERGFALVEPDWTMRELPEAFADVSVRMNDGGCDPQGRFYCGTMAYDAAPGAGTLFRLDPDESVHVVLDGVTVSNGLAWSPDGATVYYVDSDTQRIDAFDFDAGSGAFQNRRTVVQIDPDLGSPDGLTVDGEGGLWVALWDGAAVHRYSPDGRLAEVIELPTPRVSACTFGGERLDQLFITTSALNLNGSHELAGAVFRAEPGVAGLPVSCYAALPPRLPDGYRLPSGWAEVHRARRGA
jgi:sugar lactone lactonase YvrE